MEQVLSDYEKYLARLPLSKHTRRNYVLRVRAYLKWLEGTPVPIKALQDALERDFVVRDYKAYLLQAGYTSSTVNANLAAVDSLYLYLGLGTAKIRRLDLPAQAPKALDPEEQRRFLKAVLHSQSARIQAIAFLLLHCGLRVSELAALNVGDVFVTARKGELVVRCGKGCKQRKIPLNMEVRNALLKYLPYPQDPGEPLFKSQRGTRLTTNGIAHIIRELAHDAGVQMSCHSLRHTCLSRLIRLGADVVTVAEIAGHSRLETTRRYSLPTADVKISAMEKLNYAT